MKKKNAYFYANGKRKSAIATVRLYPEGEGNIAINGKTVREWSDNDEIFFRVMNPINLVGERKSLDIEIVTRGGGKMAQADSIALGIARAFVKQNGELRETLKGEGLLTRDSRVKERKKPGLRKARKSPQWSKR